MNNLSTFAPYKIFWGMLMYLSVLSNLQAQIPSCGPNQILTGYFSGATVTGATTGTVTQPINIVGVADGNTATLGANSSIILDMGSTLMGGGGLNITYRSANGDAPLQILIAMNSAGPYTNIGQLTASTTTTTASLLLPFDTRYVQLATTGTIYYPDAVAYPIYQCVNNPAPTCASGQTLMSYPSGSQGVAGTTGTVTTSNNAIGVPDGSEAVIGASSSLTLNMGSTVAAGNKLTFSYSSANATAPMQVLVATSSSGPYTNIGQIPTSTTSTTVDFTLPLAAQFIQLVTNATAFSVDAVTYPLYACVSPPSTACSSGQQSVFYNSGVQGVNTTTGTVTNTANITGVPDGTEASINSSSSLIVDMGSTVTAGNSLTFTYSSLNLTAPMQIWTSTNTGGPYTFIGSLAGSTSKTTATIMLPLNTQYVRNVRQTESS